MGGRREGGVGRRPSPAHLSRPSFFPSYLPPGGLPGRPGQSRLPRPGWPSPSRTQTRSGHQSRRPPRPRTRAGWPPRPPRRRHSRRRPVRFGSRKKRAWLGETPLLIRGQDLSRVTPGLTGAGGAGGRPPAFRGLPPQTADSRRRGAGQFLIHSAGSPVVGPPPLSLSSLTSPPVSEPPSERGMPSSLCVCVCVIKSERVRQGAGADGSLALPASNRRRPSTWPPAFAPSRPQAPGPPIKTPAHLST